jgi:hypothetical protein
VLAVAVVDIDAPAKWLPTDHGRGGGARAAFIQWICPLSLSNCATKSAGMRGRSPGAGLLQIGQGIPAPQLHTSHRLLPPQSEGRLGWFSHTQPVSSQVWQRGVSASGGVSSVAIDTSCQGSTREDWVFRFEHNRFDQCRVIGRRP